MQAVAAITGTAGKDRVAVATEVKRPPPEVLIEGTTVPSIIGYLGKVAPAIQKAQARYEDDHLNLRAYLAHPTLLACTSAILSSRPVFTSYNLHQGDRASTTGSLAGLASSTSCQVTITLSPAAALDSEALVGKFGWESIQGGGTDVGR